MPTSEPVITVLHLTPRLTRAAGGVWHYLDGLTRGLEQVGVRCCVAGVVDPGSVDYRSLAASQVIVGAPTLLPANYGFSRELQHRVDREATRVDLVHAHGFRVGTDLLAMRVAKRLGVPILLSPHGLLNPTIVSRGRAKKWLVNALWNNRYRRTVDAVLAVGETEAELVRAALPDKPCAVLPIGIDAELYAAPRSGTAVTQLAPAATGKRVLLYMAIMYANKGLGRLADAWLTIHRERPDWHLVLAGVDVAGVGAATAQRLRDAGAGDSFTLVGPVFDEAKRQLMADADLFTMPSDGESFGIALAESLASGVPIIATRGAPWSVVVERDCGWWVEPTAEALADALREATALPDDARRAMGERGRALVRERFDWVTIAPRMRALYQAVIEKRLSPTEIAGIQAQP